MSADEAVQLWKSVREDIREHGPQAAYENLLEGNDPELLALTLTLAVQSTAPLS